MGQLGVLPGVIGHLGFWSEDVPGDDLHGWETSFLVTLALTSAGAGQSHGAGEDGGDAVDGDDVGAEGVEAAALATTAAAHCCRCRCCCCYAATHRALR